MAELMVVMPVFNEQASLHKVVREWFQEITKSVDDFVFLAINDGSRDNSLKILQDLRSEFGNRLEIIDQQNKGHGQSCIAGYREAIRRGIPWIFQIDSDGQCDPQYFRKLWALRNSHEVVYGLRVRREDGIRRMLVSFVLGIFVLVFFRTFCPDPNVPYRLMRTERIKAHVCRIPSTVFLANIALTVSLAKDASVRKKYVNICFRERFGGEPTIPMRSFGAKAIELYNQLKNMDEWTSEEKEL